MGDKQECPYCRFFRKIKYDNGCWLWTGTQDKQGYGYIHDHYRNKRSYAIQAHRFAWSYLVGLIPVGKHVYHLCNNRPCVNPVHLAIGTKNDYAVDWRSEWRRKGKPYLTARQYQFMANSVVALALMVLAGCSSPKIVDCPVIVCQPATTYSCEPSSPGIYVMQLDSATCNAILKESP